MPSDAAKRKAAAKKAATASRRGGGQHADSTVSSSARDGSRAGAQARLQQERQQQQEARDTAVQLVFPPCLTARQRAVLHEASEACGIAHVSEDVPAAGAAAGGRRLVVGGGPDAERVEVQPMTAGDTGQHNGVSSSGDGGGHVMTDEQLAELMQRHFSISLPPPGTPKAPPRMPPRCKGGASTSTCGVETNGNGASSHPLGLEPLGQGQQQEQQEEVDGFVDRTLELLDMERRAEEEQAERLLACSSAEAAAGSGRTLLDLRVHEMEGGLLGHTLITLVSSKAYHSHSPQPLPPHKLSPHDVVALRRSTGGRAGGAAGAAQAAVGPPLAQGVVYRVKEGLLVVAVEDTPEEGLDEPLRVDKLSNTVTYKRYEEALQQLRGARAGSVQLPGGALVDVMFGRRQPRVVDQPAKWKPYNKGLDESQSDAVSGALAAVDGCLIHGPPGTGKTTAVVEYILQEAARGNRVLACAASNVAVDNIVERLSKADPKLKLLRLGHPARLLPQVLGCCLEAKVASSDNKGLARDCAREIKTASARLLKLGRSDYAERRALRQELRQLAKEQRRREERAVKEAVEGAVVVAATLTGVGGRHMVGQRFDVVVIDEAAQATEAACWCALLRGRKALLAGDHMQLPPTVVSDAAARGGLSRTLFERLHRMWGGSCTWMLTVQYRMHASIMSWASAELYGGRLTAADSVARHTLAGLPGVEAACHGGAGSDGEEGEENGCRDSEEGPPPVLVLVDSAGCDMWEKADAGGEGDSKLNEGEAAVVLELASRLVADGVAPRDIGIITPYNGQVALLRSMRAEGWHDMEISSVDGFQGREKEAVIISMVRSNERGQVGFLADARRMNVAVTRARRHVSLVCDSETVGRDAFLGRLVSYFEEHGEYRSAQEFEP